MTNSELERLLKIRYCPPEWAYLSQVRNRTGYGGQIRTADAIAMSLYPSRGIYIHGFEIKVSRSDWASELKAPDKAEEIARFCDFWWVVVSDKYIVHQGELPVNWGLLVPNGSGLRADVSASALSPQPLTRDIVAGILRNVAKAYAGTITKETIQNEIEAAYLAGQKHARERAEGDTQRLRSDYSDLQRTVEIFQKTSGVQLKHWPHDAQQIGEAVGYVLRGGHKAHERALVDLKEQAERVLRGIDLAVAAIKQPENSIK